MNHPATAQLASQRLRFRRLRHDDVEALCAYRSLPSVARFQSWESFGPSEAAQLIHSQLGAEPDVPGTWFQLAIVSAATGHVIGDCGLHCQKDDPRQMEIGITLAPQQQGYGYADEAIGCLVNYSFATLAKHRLFAFIDVRNRPAIALCKRAGLRQEAHLVEHRWFKGQWCSELLFAMLRREWEGL